MFFYQNLLNVLDETNFDSQCQIIIGGDFNVHHSANQDNFGGRIETKKSVWLIEDLMSAFNLVDIWRLRNPDKKQFTWRQKKPLIQRCIDYWLISDSLQDDVNNTDIKMSIKSDHSAITLCINSMKDLPFGPSYWKFNSSLLEDDTYVQLINFKYHEWLDEFSEVHDKRLLWDLVKYRIRQITIKYSKEKAQECRAQLEEAESKIHQC